MPDTNAETFIDALRTLEDDGDAEAIVALFADDATLDNLTTTDPFFGTEGARTFWTEDRGLFDTVSSEFHNVVSDDEVTVLEWTRTGTGRGGDAVAYDGVSVVTFDDDGTITRFKAYYDPARLGDQAL